jgi:uncharacterized protein (TIGR03032 family)
VSTAPGPEPRLQIDSSRNLPAWLVEQRVSLAFSTYQAGKLFLVGMKPGGELSIFERTFNRAMGLWSDGQTLWLSSAYQLWRFENALAPGQTEAGFDRLYIPRGGYTTGDIDAHDIALDADGQVVFVNTLFSCLATLSQTASFKELWRPPFITRLAAEDRCHLNGLAMQDGRPRYVTCVSRSDVADGWRERRRDGGCVFDVTTGDVIAEGLSMPHSPRLHEGRLWVLDSGNGDFGYIDLDTGGFEKVLFCPGYARGMTFVGRYAIVGLSRPREGTFTGLALSENLEQKGVSARCGLIVIDLELGEIVHWLRIEGAVGELYDVVALPGVVRPTALGFKTDEIRYTVTAEGETRVWRALGKGPDAPSSRP